MHMSLPTDTSTPAKSVLKSKPLKTDYHCLRTITKKASVTEKKKTEFQSNFF